MENLLKLQSWVDDARYIVFFGGAGVSTESGLADFRGEGGLFRKKYDYPPESMLTYDFFRKKPEIFYQFHKQYLIPSGFKPNYAHYKLAELEKSGKLRAVITQNVDGFHQMAGSENVLELHGSVYRNYCLDCGRKFSLEDIMKEEVPHCTCGGLVRPDVVLYGEVLDNDLLAQAYNHLVKADVLIVGGTSLAVYPAAGLIENYHGNKLVLINKDETPYDHRANLLIKGKIGEVLNKIKVNA